MYQRELYPTELHVSPDLPLEDWHLTEDEMNAVNRYGSHNQTGMLPESLYENLTWSDVPGTPYSPGTPGQKARNNQFLYICVSDGLWKRAPVEVVF